MKKFPELKADQVALLRAEINTGHVLDDKYNIAINDSQNVYSIFQSVEEAIIFSKKILSEKKGVEIVIYGKEEQVLHYLK